MNKPYYSREQKAQQIFEEGKVEQVGTFSFIVWSQAIKGLAYAVFNDGVTKFCECPDNGRTQKDCKHIISVDILVQKQHDFAEKVNVIAEEVTKALIVRESI